MSEVEKIKNNDPASIAEKHDKAASPSEVPAQITRLRLPPSNTKLILARILKFFSTPEGCDNALMLIQYFGNVVVWLLNKRGQKKTAGRVGKLSSMISDYRIMARLLDFFPLYLSSIDSLKNPPKDKLLSAVSILQDISMMLYYPLERIYWFGAHNIIPVSDMTVLKAGIYSCRFWAVWVVLNFIKLDSARKALLLQKKRIMSKQDSDAESMQKELGQVDSQLKAWKYSFGNTLAYLPLTVHWSLEKSNFPDVLVGVCGTIAGVCAAVNRW
ncbi:Peroxisomal membrane protein 11C [Zancudomyces culisetae]|uniref:Peroxisomal membrane protein 11C n=1 Tax=Zancudomyces culisetae TaxID=1213189 RepID=A0A1R1PTC4_ZANCU|nr:Peroxisomal membrane protein 11C [Zancudomyces culisetae]|eukprot:OMH84179.1 Peroxisomal membrane protein 11C [Zancudomyces culisetae]